MGSSPPKRKNRPKVTGRTNTKFDEEKYRQLKAICRMKPTLSDCAAFLDVNESTIEKQIRKRHNCTFSDFREQNMVHTRFMVIRGLLDLCEKGNLGALIYTSKNLCGWTDKYDVDIENKLKPALIKKRDGSVEELTFEAEAKEIEE